MQGIKNLWLVNAMTEEEVDTLLDAADTSGSGILESNSTSVSHPVARPRGVVKFDPPNLSPPCLHGQPWNVHKTVVSVSRRQFRMLKIEKISYLMTSP